MENTLCMLMLTVVCVVKVGGNHTLEDSPTQSNGNLYEIGKSALGTCGQSVDTIMFPPSDATKEKIDEARNLTIAKSNMKQQLELFCSNVDDYSACVKEKLSSESAVIEDQLLRLFIDSNSVPAAFKTLCENRDLVVSQFECTYQSLQSTTCNGGIVDIVIAIFAEMNSRSGVFGYTCKDFKPRIECRIQKQLTPCSVQLANVMSDHIKGILKDDCVEGGYIEPSTQYRFTELTACFLEFGAVIEKRPSSPVNTVEEMAAYIVDMMKSFCRYATDMIECAFERTKTSDYPMDKMFRKASNHRNMKAIVDYGCSKIHLISKYSVCIMNGMKSQFTNNSCLMAKADKYVNGMSALFNMSSTSTDIDTLKNNVCMLMEVFGSCTASVFSNCNAELGDVFSNFVEYNVRTCKDPNYVVPTVSNNSVDEKGSVPDVGSLRTPPFLSTLLLLIVIANTV